MYVIFLFSNLLVGFFTVKILKEFTENNSPRILSNRFTSRTNSKLLTVFNFVLNNYESNKQLIVIFHSLLGRL